MFRILLPIAISFLATNSVTAQEAAADPNDVTHCSYRDVVPIKSVPELKWRFELDWNQCSEVVVADGLILANAFDKESQQGTQHAIDQLTGELRWSNSIRQRLSKPVVSGQAAYYGSKSNQVYALDLSDGAEVWTFSRIGGFACNTPVVSQGRVFFGTHDGGWYVVDAKDGNLIQEVKTSKGICCSPSTRAGAVYFVDWAGDLHCQQVSTLQSSVLLKTDVSSHVAPTIVGKTGLLTNDSGLLLAFDMDSGQELWRFRPDGQLWRNPSVANGSCIVVTDKSHVYCLDVQTGKQKWDVAKSGTVYTSATIARTVAYISCGDHYLYALEVDTGDELWRLPTKATASQPWAADNMIYFAAGKGIYAYQKPSQ